MCQTDIIISTSKAKTSKLTFDRLQRYNIRKSRLVLYNGVLITYEEYQTELSEN